jgi:hypothetical protein
VIDPAPFRHRKPVWIALGENPDRQDIAARPVLVQAGPSGSHQACGTISDRNAWLE